MKQQFYSLGSTWTNKWFLGRIMDEDVQIVDEWVINKAMRGFKWAVHVNIVKGKDPGDILEVGFPIFVVSSNVLKVWKEFAKFETYRVVIENREIPFDYYGVAFLGRGGPFDPVKSKATYSKSVNSQGNRAIMNMEGLYFDDSQWDGSDLLTVDDFPCHPIITKRVMETMKKAKITNCKYTPLEEYKFY